MIIEILAILGGIILLALCADWLVQGAVGLASRMGVSPLFIGMTVVALGTSMPEMVVSIQASLEGNSAIAVGNVVGSNVFNVAVILGISALIRPMPCSREVVRREVPVMILVSVLFWLLVNDGLLSRGESLFLLLLLILYTAISYRISSGLNSTAPQDDTPGKELPTLGCSLGNIVTGLLGLVGGSKLLLYGAVTVATAIGISDEVIGLTLIAAGTSLPELAASGVAAWKGQSEIALGNVIGSNLMNILAILGVAGTMLPLEVSGHMAGVDIPVMIFVSLGCLPIMRSGYRISRLEGGVLVLFYLGYMVALFRPS